MSRKSKSTRTQIEDMPEKTVELSAEEMRLVVGGLRGNAFGCGGRSRGGTNVVTGQGDWDTD